jgi:hypothetical protein
MTLASLINYLLFLLIKIVIFRFKFKKQYKLTMNNERIIEIPNCSVCHEELLKDLKITMCGHVFHSNW